MNLIYTETPVQKEIEFFGNELLSAAERKAVEKGCHSAYLYTYSFQSPEFYEKNGYATFGKLENFYGEHEKLFLNKHFA